MTDQRPDKPTIAVTDSDGDSLECVEVFGMGEPALAVFVTQEGEECGVNLTLATARELRDYLNAFLWRHDTA
jgi:hypothetical protein